MYFLIIGVTVVTLVAVVVRMNSDPTLSSIAGTNANEVTWDARFVLGRNSGYLPVDARLVIPAIPAGA